MNWWSSVLWQDIAHFITNYGLLVVAVVIGLESIGLPFPGESVLILAGIFAGTRHELNIVWVIVVAAVAAIVGQAIGYAIGREFGYRLLLRFGPYVRVTESRIKLGEYLFLRHGGKIVFFGRFVAILRTFAALLAGANRMSWPHFLAMNALGGVCWASLFGGGAYLFGETIKSVAGPIGALLLAVAIGLIVAGTVFFRRHETELEARANAALEARERLRTRREP